MIDDWDIMDDLAETRFEEERQSHRGSFFNKEKFCKRNKEGKGQHGPHTYVNGRCSLCNKIDPRIKFNKE